jgi:hypothetical protein
MNTPLIPNRSEDLFLRCWYATKGCAAPLTDSGRFVVDEMLKARYSLGYSRSEVREEVIKAFINSTAEREAASHSHEKKRFVLTVDAFLAKLKAVKERNIWQTPSAQT